jgi:hypothetical protein
MPWQLVKFQPQGTFATFSPQESGSFFDLAFLKNMGRGVCFADFNLSGFQPSPRDETYFVTALPSPHLKKRAIVGRPDGTGGAASGFGRPRRH